MRRTWKSRSPIACDTVETRLVTSVPKSPSPMIEQPWGPKTGCGTALEKRKNLRASEHLTISRRDSDGYWASTNRERSAHDRREGARSGIDSVRGDVAGIVIHNVHKLSA